LTAGRPPRLLIEAAVLTVLTEEIRVVRILREEEERLTALKYRSKRERP
jgi:hypothetical protein